MAQARIRIYGRPPYRSRNLAFLGAFCARTTEQRIVASNVSDGRTVCDAGTHSLSAGSPYKACQKRDTVIVLRHYEGVAGWISRQWYMPLPTPRRQGGVPARQRAGYRLIQTTPTRGTSGQRWLSRGTRPPSSAGLSSPYWYNISSLLRGARNRQSRDISLRPTGAAAGPRYVSAAAASRWLASKRT